MASPAMAPPAEPASPRWVRALLALAVVVPMVVMGLLLAHDGWRSDIHGAFLSRVHFAENRGQLQLLGFEYPPLPFLLLLPWPTDLWIMLLAGAALFGLVWMVLADCTWQRSMLPFVLLLAVLWTPIGLHLVAGDFNEAVGLFALYVGWRHYRRWWATRKTIHGLYTGLWLGVAFYTSPLGLALALVAGAILPIIFPRLQIPPFASQLVLLVFPGVAATATWAYLSWIFTHRVAFPFTPWEPNSPGFATVLVWTVPYLVVSLLALLRFRATTAGVLLPFALLVLANRVGWHFSLAFATGLLTLVAIVALPTDLRTWQRALVAGVAIAQAIAAWWLIPFPRLTEADLAAHAIANALASAPDRSILIDDRFAAQLLKWAPSLAPYLTTRDTGFDLALAEPAARVDYVLVTAEGDGLLTLDATDHPPSGFVLNWSWDGYTLYRRPTAPRLAVRYDAVLAADRGMP
jgi:hypothetical protein